MHSIAGLAAAPEEIEPSELYNVHRNTPSSPPQVFPAIHPELPSDIDFLEQDLHQVRAMGTAEDPQDWGWDGMGRVIPITAWANHHEYARRKAMCHKHCHKCCHN
jgi:hypothetical protein